MADQNMSIVPPVWLLRYWDVNGTLSFFVNGFGIYVIINFSTTGMQTYKWFLLNILIMTFIVDIFMCFLLRPIALFPLWGGYAVGLGSMIHPESCRVVIPLLLFFINNCTASITNGFLYRWFVLRPQWWIMLETKRILKVLLLWQFVMALPESFVAHFGFIPREIREEYIRKNYPHLISITTLRSWDIWNPDISPYNYVLLSFLFAWLVVFVTICVIAVTQIKKILGENKSSMSEKTIKMHRQLTLVLAIQTSTPFTIYVIPMCIAMATVWFNIWGVQGFCNVLLAIFSIHSNLNVILMISLVKPYREGAMDFFLKIAEKVSRKDLRKTRVLQVSLSPSNSSNIGRNGEKASEY